MIDTIARLTILMASATYLTRIGGYLWLRSATVRPRATAVLKTAPGCLPVAVIAPHFALDRSADLAAPAVTMSAATRLSLLSTVLLGIISAGALRHFLG